MCAYDIIKILNYCIALYIPFKIVMQLLKGNYL